MQPTTPSSQRGRARRLPVILVLGFASGMPLYLTAQTLTAWMAVEGVDLATIGAFALVGLPYTFKWVWAPLFDRFRLPWLGRRRGWMIALQLALVLAIAALGGVHPAAAPALLAAAAALTALLSASHDVVVDAFVAETLPPDERAAGSTVYVFGYRLGILVGGSATLLLAALVSWRAVYVSCAAAMLLGVGATLIADEPSGPSAAAPRSLAQTVSRAVTLLLGARRGLAVLGFVALFRFGDHLAQTLLVPFLVKHVGFTLGEVATLSQALGLAGLLAGGAIAGAMVPRLGVRRSLWLFGGLQAATNLGYAALAVVGPSRPLLAAVVLGDNLANAMGIAAFLAFLMSRCERSVTATQYALLTSLSSVGARVFGFLGGPIVDGIGWSGFFVATALAALPALLLLDRVPEEG